MREIFMIKLVHNRAFRLRNAPGPEAVTVDRGDAQSEGPRATEGGESLSPPARMARAITCLPVCRVNHMSPLSD